MPGDVDWKQKTILGITLIDLQMALVVNPSLSIERVRDYPSNFVRHSRDCIRPIKSSDPIIIVGNDGQLTIYRNVRAKPIIVKRRDGRIYIA